MNLFWGSLPMRTTFRHDDTMIAVATRPAVIAFQDILERVEVVRDKHNSDTPWDHCDGYEHTATPIRRLDSSRNAPEMQGWCHADGDRVVIEIPRDEDWGIYKYMRERGASRQVAREGVAAEKRRTIRQLVRWYEDGWEWFGVRCRFDALEDRYEDSVWGIDDEDYAQTLTEEVAWNVATQLEKAGYTVTGKPEPTGPTATDRRARLRRNMEEQNWRE
jgi:hypothetical protein